MCGIAGLLAVDQQAAPDSDAVRRMCDAMVHRGPDDHGLRTDGPCVLGHRRLSIIDLRPEGVQPMTNEDDTISVVVNGEIYNFVELRKELEQHGHRFKSRSDSEVVLHLYEEHGVDFLGHLRGMFALALWDGPRRRLVLARDRFGKKPLYYHIGPEGLVFASELGGLVASRHFEKRPDLDAIDAFMCLQYVPAPMTAFEGVKKLPAGHWLVCENGVIHETEPYFALRFDEPHTGTVKELTQELRDLLEESVRVRLMSDVPLGAFLSGGLDSSLIVALMARRSSQPVKTFSVGFTSKDHSELPYAKMVADRYETDHHEMVVEPDMASVVPELVRHYGEPFADSSALPTWYLCQYTRTGVTVALSGDGGDEAFGGYRRYMHSRTARAIRRLPWPLPRLVASMLSHLPTPQAQEVRDYGERIMQPEYERFLGLCSPIPHKDRMVIYSAQMRERFARDQVAAEFERLFKTSSARDPVNRVLDVDIRTYLSDNILTKVDIASMAHSLEVRCPLVDQEVMRFAASLPGSMKIRGLTTKFLLRRVAEELVPSPIFKRSKQGFGLPINRWMREDLAPLSRDVLLDQTARERGILDPTAVQDMLARQQRGEPRGFQIWSMMILELWYRECVEG
ncbi:MAG: asparagine synthase (glutamine-hydrolyzing) [Myxococcales bacterium]|nr:asparagine synthase (glutamine-hydrolyzing) [Myxococcales bacterium]